MKAIISGSQDGKNAVTGGPHGTSGKALTLLIGAMMLIGLPGCLRLGFGGGDDAGSRTSKNTAETAISREVAEMVKLYRICLQKNEDNPVKAKENCGMYNDAIRDLAPDMNQLRDKHPSHRRDVEP